MPSNPGQPTPRHYRWRVVGVCGAALAAVALLAAAADYSDAQRWWAPDSGRLLPARLEAATPSGSVATLNLAGPVDTTKHPFFTPLGSNGRACVTCHQPADGMSLSVATIGERWRATQGRDPLFAMIDGANCPSLPQGQQASHSLLLTRGLFRIARPWPPVAPDGRPITPEFSIEVLRDPTGCNTDAQHGLTSAQPYVSVYRRPRPATNLKYATTIGFDFEPKTGLPMLLDPVSGAPTAGNLMADGRALTLRAQALDAMRWHLQTPGQPDETLVQQLIAFETMLYTAASRDQRAGALDADGAQGGPELLARAQAGALQSTASNPSWEEEFKAWRVAASSPSPAAAAGSAAPSTATADAQQQAMRASILRGVEVYSRRTFLISDSAGLTNIPLGNPVRDGCSLCHNMLRSGMDVAPGQIDLGTTNVPHADGAPDLPLFKLTCRPDAKPHPYLGRVVTTQDPGYALTTGQCRDIGKITMQQMRGLSARAPYFSNGSARTLREIVDFYDRRYRIGYTEQEKQDLTNLLGAL